MSKNVAVFVDVANIFYAAKAAGVDIDYVTLLKSATAGRDLVRAYAYTGLDPENENQKNFHEFLKRSGYKVVSKDIRKYGDGRIKANLDIELVVDLMRLAPHLDIAVVISGDGDFAPAIKAVQQMGVRVDVISFSGNTSSDLKEVADDFYEITHLAKVEKGARSGRRVASDDDLSMTAVPEKETDNGPRRRRGGTGRGRDRDDRGFRDRGDRETREPRELRETREPREPRVAAVDAGLPGNVIVLPGERLSRAPQDLPEDIDLDEEVLEGTEPAAEGEAGEGEGEGRRRRRRRGGRGRGRGRRAEGEGEAVADGAPVADAETVEADEEEFLEEELPTAPQHSTFGSVWDVQIGLPKQPVSTAASTDDVEEYDDEPEIPEYLLAERRQAARGNRGGRNRGGRSGGGNRGGGGYQSAVDRERFGRSGPALFAGSGNSGNSGNRQGGGDRNRGGGGDRNRQGGGDRNQGQNRRPQPAPAPRDRDVAPVSSSAEPWSEVPPEVQELLRAEMARRQPGKLAAAAPAPKAADAPSGRGGRRSSKPAAEAPAPVEAVAAPVEEAAAKPTRRRSTKAAAEAAPVAEAPAPVAEAPVEEAPKATRKRTTKAAAAPAEAPAPAEEAPAVEAPKPARKRTTKAAAAVEEAPAVEAPAEEPKKPARKRTTKAAAEPAEG